VDGQTTARFLDGRGFKNISFRGEYPIGRVEYQEAEFPVQVALEAFSPFIPLNVDDSSLPATILCFELTNSTTKAVEVSLAGWMENSVCRHGDGGLTLGLRNTVRGDSDRVSVTSSVEQLQSTRSPRPDIVFENWARDSYESWSVEGTAFGSGPIQRAAMPTYQGDVGGPGEQVVNSHATAPGEGIEAKDACQGKLTSRRFTVDRDFISVWIGGGAHPGKTCVNLKVDGSVVQSITARNSNRMQRRWLDVRSVQGKRAVLEIVDLGTSAWGNVGVGEIVFTDRPAANRLDELPGYGSMALSLIGPPQGTSAAADLRETLDAAQLFEALGATSARDAARRWDEPRPIGAVQRTLTIPPGGKAAVHFAVCWWFPNIGPLDGEMSALADVTRLKRHYAARFSSADAVAEYVCANFQRLAADTRLWNKTWYDSTLPFWLLDRTFLTVDCLATQTLLAFDNGRWWGWEGVNCCPGTCQHVWQYAQSMARLFPAIERDLRERVDFGLAWHDDGAMDYRAEHARQVAHDGFCGTILRAYREHQMCADDSFLQRLWPRIRQSIEWIMAQDRDRDGLLEGEQMNTLDAAWNGPMGWISSLYLAALSAGEAMALQMRDTKFLARCREVLEVGRQQIVNRLFNGEYFIHVPADDRHTNTNDGCHIDQMLGQSFAFQLGLPRIIGSRESLSALRSLWTYNFSPDVGVYRAGMKPVIPSARWYAMPGEAGLLMCTWPRGGSERANGGGNPTFVGYFIECMTGFEYQVASHMIWEGMVEEGLAITRAIHDRYSAAKRNPYNEIECSDHYSRAMMSYGVFLAICGYEYHGPNGYLGFAPRVTPDNFRAPFTTAEGWGTFSQQRTDHEQREVLTLAWGKLRLRRLSFELAEGKVAARVSARHGEKDLTVSKQQRGRRLEINLPQEIAINAGETVALSLAFS
jgi:uncharacterized protein (DUF608 family)